MAIGVAGAAVVAALGVAVSTAPTAVGAELGCIPGRPAALLVSYARTGGIVGLRDRLRVYRGGQATLLRRSGPQRTFRLSCRRVQALRDALRNARFSTLAPVYAPDTPVADGFVESVTYGGRRVQVLTGAEPPPRLARVLNLLRDIVARRR